MLRICGSNSVIEDIRAEHAKLYFDSRNASILDGLVDCLGPIFRKIDAADLASVYILR